MKGVQECYDLSMKSPARKDWKRLVTFTLRIKEAHSSPSASSPKTFKREEKHCGGRCWGMRWWDIITVSTRDTFLVQNSDKTHLIRMVLSHEHKCQLSCFRISPATLFSNPLLHELCCFDWCLNNVSPPSRYGECAPYGYKNAKMQARFL